jgi:hypothetical protein
MMRKCGRSFKDDSLSDYHRSLKQSDFLTWHFPNVRQPGSISFEGLFADILSYRAARRKVTVFTSYGLHKVSTIASRLNDSIGSIPSEIIADNSEHVELEKKK